VFRCSACGREFESGATIVDGVVLCPDCARKLDDIIDNCVYEQVVKMVNGEKMDIDSCIERHSDEIKRLGLRPARVKLIVLSHVLRHVPLVRGAQGV